MTNLDSALNAIDDANKIEVSAMDDHQGKTWEEIVGTTMDANIIDNNILKSVKVASIDGESVTAANDLTVSDEKVVYGTQEDATHNGIVGMAICLGDDCVVGAGPDADDADGRMLTGSWYFTPNSEEQTYLRNADDTAYVEEDMFVKFGHWLTTDGTDFTIHTYAYTEANTSGLDVDQDDDDNDVKATYKGDAVGMSVVNDSDGEAISSGAFTAKVNLTATFATAPTIEGTIKNFSGNVGDNWEVTLMNAAFTNAALAAGVTVTDGLNGTWSAQGYGPAAVGDVSYRPTGIFGNFNAHFDDGAAAGAYATRKVE
jgi:hypothetical protein